MSYLTASCGLSGVFQRVFVSLDILRAVIWIYCKFCKVLPQKGTLQKVTKYLIIKMIVWKGRFRLQ